VRHLRHERSKAKQDIAQKGAVPQTNRRWLRFPRPECSDTDSAGVYSRMAVRLRLQRAFLEACLQTPCHHGCRRADQGRERDTYARPKRSFRSTQVDSVRICFCSFFFLLVGTASGYNPAPWRTALSSSQALRVSVSIRHCRRKRLLKHHKQCRPDPREKLSRWPGERTPLAFGCPTEGREKENRKCTRTQST
jgi:hypothetical protein